LRYPYFWKGLRRNIEKKHNLKGYFEMKILIFHPLHSECYSAIRQLEGQCEFVNAYTNQFRFVRGIEYHRPIHLAILYMPNTRIIHSVDELRLRGGRKNCLMIIEIFCRQIPFILLRKAHGFEDFFSRETTELLSVETVFWQRNLSESYFGINWRFVLKCGMLPQKKRLGFAKRVPAEVHRGYPNPP